jgi:integrase
VPRYRSTFNLAELLESAREELASQYLEQYKIFLLGALAGLRRSEIDSLPWSAFRFDEGVIRIETTEHYRPKSHNSEGDVHVDPELLEVFRGYYARRKSELLSRATPNRLPLMRPMAFIVARTRYSRSSAGFAARASSHASPYMT